MFAFRRPRIDLLPAERAVPGFVIRHRDISLGHGVGAHDNTGHGLLGLGKGPRTTVCGPAGVPGPNTLGTSLYLPIAAKSFVARELARFLISLDHYHGARCRALLDPRGQRRGAPRQHGS